LVVENQALGASANGTIPSDGAPVAQDLTLSASGSVTGKVVRANGSTPAGGIDVLFFFTSQSTLPGRALVRTDSNGNFSATMIPVGAFNLEASAPQVGGLARRAGTLTSNGQTLDLGNVVLDEDFSECRFRDADRYRRDRSDDDGHRALVQRSAQSRAHRSEGDFCAQGRRKRRARVGAVAGALRANRRCVSFASHPMRRSRAKRITRSL
jgi:hypothetical protein